jgi:hypothetical protein
MGSLDNLPKGDQLYKGHFGLWKQPSKVRSRKKTPDVTSSLRSISFAATSTEVNVAWLTVPPAANGTTTSTGYAEYTTELARPKVVTPRINVMHRRSWIVFKYKRVLVFMISLLIVES